MRESAAILGVGAAALLVIAVAVFAGGDRSLFVPVPEMVTENFAREVATRRFDLSMKYLAHDRQRSESARTLEGLFAPLLSDVGTVNMVDARIHWVSGQRAAAEATIEGQRGTRSFDVSLVREKDGLWKIDALPNATVSRR